MKYSYFIFILCLQGSIASAVEASKSCNLYFDNLLAQTQQFPRDYTRLKTMEKLVLTKQGSAGYIDCIQSMYNEAKFQKNEKYICKSSYLYLIYYYNADKPDSVFKWASYLSPIAEHLHYWTMYFNAQKILINTYIYKRKYEFAITEVQKMLDKAKSQNSIQGEIAALQCLANAYHETNRKAKEKATLLKAYQLFPKISEDQDKIDILFLIIDAFKNNTKVVKKYLDKCNTLMKKTIAESPDMNGAYSNLFLYLYIAYSDYYASIEKQDLAKFYINAARQYITPQSYPLYLGTYYDACTRYYLSRKNYHLTLNYCDSALANYKKGTSNEMQYAKQLTFKANILQEMNEYKKAILLYRLSNHLQDSISKTISAVQSDEIKETYHYDKLIWEKGKIMNIMKLITLITIGFVLITIVFYLLRVNHMRKALKSAEQETLKAAREAERINNIKTNSLANMSHAIRIPLNGVVGFSQLLATESGLDEATQKEYSEIIQQNTEKLMRLVNNILDLSRLEADMMKFQVLEYDIVQICNDAIHAVAMQNPNIQVSFISDLDQYDVQVDVSQMMKLIESTLALPWKIDNAQQQPIIFTLGKTGEILRFKILHSPLADFDPDNQEISIRNEINALFLKKFRGTYQSIKEGKDAPAIIFTYPAISKR
jgi:tetratricopeptide (TPR) repeat protein